MDVKSPVWFFPGSGGDRLPAVVAGVHPNGTADVLVSYSDKVMLKTKIGIGKDSAKTHLEEQAYGDPVDLSTLSASKEYTDLFGAEPEAAPEPEPAPKARRTRK